MLGLAGAGKLMILPLENNHAAVHAHLLQGRKQLIALGDGAAVIAVGMDDQCGRLEIGGILQRRLLPHLFRVLKDGVVGLIFAEEDADIGNAIEADPVGDAPLGGGAAEAVCVADDPVGHKAAVAAAGDGHTPLVDLGIARQHRVGKVHQVLIFRLTVAAPDVSKGVAPAIGADGIAEEDKIALPRPILHLMIEYLAIDRAGATVNVQNGGIGLAGVVIDGLQDPAGDVLSLAAQRDLLIVGNIAVLQRLFVKFGKAGIASVLLQPVKLLQLAVQHGDGQQLAVFADIKGIDGAFAAKNHPGLSHPVNAQQLAASTPGPQGIDRVLRHPEAIAAAQTAVATHGVIKAVVVFAKKAQRAGLHIIAIEKGAFLIGIGLPLAHGEQQAALPAFQRGEIILPLRIDTGKLAACRVHRKQAGAIARAALIPFAVKIQPSPAENRVGDIHLRRRQPQHRACGGIKGEQGGALSAPVGAAVVPEGMLLQDDIVLVLLFLRLPLFPLLRREKMGVRAVLLYAGGEVIPAVSHGKQLAGLQRQLKGLLPFAAVGGQAVIGRKGLPRLRPLFLCRRAAGREEQMGLVLPEEGPFLPHAGKAADPFAVPEIEIGAIVVVFPVAAAHSKGGLPAAGRIAEIGQKAVIQKLIQLQWLHKGCFSFLFEKWSAGRALRLRCSFQSSVLLEPSTSRILWRTISRRASRPSFRYCRGSK